MITFIGEYSGKVDDKGRLVLPSPFKNLLPTDGDTRFVVKRNIFDGCLDMFTYAEWERQSNEIYNKLNIAFNRDHARFWREYMRDRDVVEPDSKLGRISISRDLLDAIGVTKEVVFLGIGSKLEVWAKETYETSRISNEKYVSIARSLSTK